MYLLFRYHHIMPGEYEKMGFGERTVVRAFMHYQIEQMNEEVERIKRGSVNGKSNRYYAETD